MKFTIQQIGEMTQSRFDEICKDFDRQIKEAKAAAAYSPSLAQKLRAIEYVKTLQNDRVEFRRARIIFEFEQFSGK